VTSASKELFLHRERRVRRGLPLAFCFLFLSSLAGAQVYNFLRAEKDEWESDNGLMAPPGSIILFYDSLGPLSFVTMSPRDLPGDAVQIGEVYARTCQYGIGIPLIPPTSPTSSGTSISGVKGNGSYQRTVLKLKTRYPELRGIFDVRVDDQTTSVLAIFRRLCTEITARGFK